LLVGVAFSSTQFGASPFQSAQEDARVFRRRPLRIRLCGAPLVDWTANDAHSYTLQSRRRPDRAALLEGNARNADCTAIARSPDPRLLRSLDSKAANGGSAGIRRIAAALGRRRRRIRP